MTKREKLIEFIKKNYQKDGDEYNDYLDHAWTLGCGIVREFNLGENYEKLLEKALSGLRLPGKNQSEYIADIVLSIIYQFSVVIENATEWISVKDKFPPGIEENNNDVLLYHPFERVDGTKNFIIFVGYWDDLNDIWCCGWSSMFPPYIDFDFDDFILENTQLKKDQVTHWMPLPKPPEE